MTQPHFADPASEQRPFSLDVHRRGGGVEAVAFIAYADLDSAITLAAMGAEDEREQAAATMELFLHALVDDDGWSLDANPDDGQDAPPESECSSRRRFWAIMQSDDRWISLRVLRQVGAWLMEGAVDLPTQQPGPRSPGQANRRPGQPSRATRR